MNMAVDPSRRIRVLVIDADGEFARRTCARLESDGLTVASASTLDQAVAAIDDGRFTVVILDPQLPGSDECECLSRIRSVDRRIRLIVYTASRSYELAKTAANLNLSAFVEKSAEPASLEQLANGVRRA